MSFTNRSDKTSEIIDALEIEEGFSEGPNPSKDIKIREHEKIIVTFRGNVTFEDEEVEEIVFVYNSNKNGSKGDMFVREVDRYVQHGLENFRGIVQFWKEERKEDSQETDRVLVCELPVNIPKVYKNQILFSSLSL